MARVIEERDAAVGLRVEIDEQRLAAAHRQRGGKVHGCRGLADAAFLIGDGDDHVLKTYMLWRSDAPILGIVSRRSMTSRRIYGRAGEIGRVPCVEAVILVVTSARIRRWTRATGDRVRGALFSVRDAPSDTASLSTVRDAACVRLNCAGSERR